MSQLQYEVFDRFEIKPSRWITLSEQKEFIDFLRYFGYHKPVKSYNNGKVTEIDILEKLQWCASIVEKYECSQDPTHPIHIKYRLCGQRGVCPRCSKAYAHKRAMITYQWLRFNLAQCLDFDLKLNQIVLTLPESLHDIDRRLFSKMIKQMMREMGIESYGYVIQDDHSQNPLSGVYLHAHVLSLNMKVENNQVVQSDYFFDLNDMREKWKSVIFSHTGMVVEGSVNLHSEYVSVINDPPKVLHILAYCYRYPIEDLFNVQVRYKTRDYAKTSILNYLETQKIEKSAAPYNILQIDVRERIEKMIESKPRLVWCGWLTSTKRAELTGILGMPGIMWHNLRYYEDRLDERSKRCRNCEGLLCERPFEVGQYQEDNEPS